MAWAMYGSAMVREKTDLTPYTLASFAHRHYRNGRRFAGSSTTDAMSPGTRHAGRSEVSSLDSYTADEDGYDLADVLADPRLDNRPLEQVRVNHDYPLIVKRSQLSRRARQVWRELLKDYGDGHVTRLAKKLHVTPGRICQAKTELATALEEWGYRPRGWKHNRGRPRLTVITGRRHVGGAAHASSV